MADDGAALFLGARPRPGLREEIAAGHHPRVDYLELRAKYPLRQVDFDTLDADRSTLLRAARCVNPYWRLALWLRGPGRHLGRVLFTGEDIGVPAALAQRATGGRTELYVIAHGSLLNSPRARRVLRLAARGPRVHFLALSSALTGQLIRDFGVDPARAETVGYGVDAAFFRPEPAAAPGAGRPVIVSAGTASRDYRTLVAAVADLDADVRIAADSEWFPAALDIHGADLPANIDARSYGDYVRLRDLYASATVVVVPLYPGRHASGYAVIAEAMAMGKPVIATRTASPSDFIVEGETGFLVPPGDAAALRERVLPLLDHPDTAARMGAAGRARIAATYTVEAYADRLARALGLGRA